MSAQQHWDYSYDVVVVGSGNGGLTAALCSYEMGTRDVLVIEKSALYGGTSSISGGGVWIPGNRYARAAGAEDSVDKARTYLRQLISDEEVPAYQLDAFLENGPKMFDFLHERSRVRYVTLEHYPITTPISRAPWRDTAPWSPRPFGPPSSAMNGGACAAPTR